MRLHKCVSLIIILFFLVFQFSCAGWPEHGEGGMAEEHVGSYIPVEVHEEISFEHGLRFDTELLQHKLDVLIVNGADYCFPATVVQAEHRENRILRELHGGLYYDAANDVLIQRQLLSRLERQLDYVLVEGTCRPQSDSKKMLIADNESGELSKMLYNLLNSDNQFAEDSYQLNPKYVARLAEAAVLLRDHQLFNLNIIGHADIVGDHDYNQSLSLRRAQQVSRYLEIMGIESGRITVRALGETLPLYEGAGDHIRLVNRRVTIELVEPALSKSVSAEVLNSQGKRHE